jgi:hypothetical protein
LNQGGDINTRKIVLNWFLENGGKSKGELGWTTSTNPYQPDIYLDVLHIFWKNVQVFIGERKGPNGVQGLEIAFLLNTNFPVEEGYEETLVELQDLVGPEFTIDSGYTEHLEIWMTYLETIEGHELETLQRIQNASELAFRMATIASGIRHIPEINLR